MRNVYFILVASLFVLSGCGRTGLYERTELMMGTVIRVKVADRIEPASGVDRAIEKAFSRMREVDESMSLYNSNSELSRINGLGPGQMIGVSDGLLEVVRKSIEISNISSGAFDITTGPLIELWGFGKDDTAKEAPSPEQIEAILPMVNYRSIVVDEKHKRIGLEKAGMEIDLSSIAKGYAVDKAIEVLREEGIENAIVDAGGDLYCLGRGLRRAPWVIGIKDPRRPGQVIASFKLTDRACATSGDYENFFITEGRKFSHLIDPRTGRPVQNGLLSVTVLAPTCLEADGLATAIFVLGKKEGLELINNLDKTEAIIISQQGSEVLTSYSEGLCLSDISN